jgi:tRNA(Leu) C34 or U34 (ribose-2'-O)-methylase TrmL
MLDIVLYETEFSPHTGNIIRPCANTKFDLHLIHPLGLELMISGSVGPDWMARMEEW